MNQYVIIMIFLFVGMGMGVTLGIIASHPNDHATITYNGLPYRAYITSNDSFNSTPLALINTTDVRLDSKYYYPQNCSVEPIHTYVNRTTAKYLSVEMYISPDLTKVQTLLNIPTKDGGINYIIDCTG